MSGHRHPTAVDPDLLRQDAYEAELVRREEAVEEVSAPVHTAGASSTVLTRSNEVSPPSGAVVSNGDGPTLPQQLALIPAFMRAHADILEQLGMQRERTAALRLAWDIEREIQTGSAA